MRNLCSILLIMFLAFDAFAQITITIPDTTIQAGSSVQIPVYTSAIFEFDSVNSYQMQISFDSDLLHLNDPVFSNTMTPVQWSQTYNLNISGLFIGGAWGISPFLTGDSVLMYLDFDIEDSASGNIPLNFNYFLYNAGQPEVITVDGSITVNDSLSGIQSGVIGSGVYYVNSNLIVESGTTLTLESGVELMFLPGCGIIVNGYLEAEGTVTDSIIFGPISPDSIWSGMNFIDFQSSAGSFRYCSIYNSYTDGNGGAIRCGSGSDITIRNSIFTNNYSEGNGGAIECYYSDAELTQCIFSGNTSEASGGAVHIQSANPQIVSCDFTGNWAESGGAISTIQSDPFILNCLFSDNGANQYSGGIRFLGSMGIVDKCVIEDNMIAGVFIDGGSTQIVNSTFSGNPTSVKCTTYPTSVVSGNIICNSSVAGIDLILAADVSIDYNDFFGNGDDVTGNTIPAGFGQINTVNYNGDPCDQYFNMFMDPMFQSISGENAYWLNGISPCIDAGDPESSADPDGTVADLGAFYYHQLLFGYFSNSVQIIGELDTGTDLLLIDDGNYAALHTSATDLYDMNFDIPEPGHSPDDYLSIYFPHPEWSTPLGDNFLTDVRNGNDDLTNSIKIYNFEVDTDIEGDTVFFAFEPGEEYSDDYGIVLYDPSVPEYRNLRENQFHQFITDGSIRSFQLRLGDATPPEIDLIFPAPDTILNDITNYEILWDITDVSPVRYSRVFYSVDDGLSWVFMDSLNGTTSNTNWTPPEVVTQNARIRIQSEDWAGNSTDFISDVFTIVSSDFIPLGGEVNGNLPPYSNYYVLGNMLVEVGDSLSIGNGTTLIFSSGSSLEINGYVSAVGTAGQEIIFGSSSGSSTWGGIVFTASSSETSTLDNCVITGSINGGIRVVDCSPILTNLEIYDNFGSGIYLENANTTISECNIHNNTNTSEGGGLQLNNSTVILSYCTIRQNNSLLEGGGVFVDNNSQLVIDHCTIIENNSILGGGLSCADSVSVRNSIFNNNIGGAIYFHDPADCSVEFNDFYQNTPMQFSGVVPPDLGIETILNSNGDPCDNFYNIFLNPDFYAVSGDSAYFLNSTSPCIDAGDPEFPLDDDNTLTDMGRFYFDQSSRVPVDGYCELIGAQNHAGIQVAFDAVMPPAESDTAYTFSTGYYQISLEPGEYDIRYNFPGYYGQTLENVIFASGTTLQTVTLDTLPPGVYIEGQLSGLLEDTLYYVIGDIYVSPGDTLMIEAGAGIKFEGHYSFLIQGRLNASGESGDTISFAPKAGTDYWKGLEFSSAEEVSILQYVSIKGSNETGVHVSNSNIEFHNCCIAENLTSATGSGGGLYFTSSDAVIYNCVIENDTTAAGNGGGIYAIFSGLQIINSEIRSNYSAHSGGGIYGMFGSNIQIEGSWITANYAFENGGGLYLNSGASGHILKSVVHGNTADISGGGCMTYSGGFNFDRCTFNANSSASDGSGIFIWDAMIDLRNTIFSNHTTNTSLYFNGAAAMTSSIEYNDFYNNNISFGGDTPDNIGVIDTANFNGDDCDSYFNIFADPLYADPLMGNFYILDGSPCIDAGDPASTADPDFGSIADIGAYYHDQSGDPVQIEGYCFLENQSDHSNIEVKFIPLTIATDTVVTYTGSTGYYTDVVNVNNYEIQFSREGYADSVLTNFSISPGTQIQDVTLEYTLPEMNLSGAISGILELMRYNVIGNLVVLGGSSLYIPAGCEFIFHGDYVFQIVGDINAAGTEEANIIFSPDNGVTKWKGFNFVLSSESQVLTFCDISGASNSANNPGAVIINGADVELVNCSIHDNPNQGIKITGGSPTIKGCDIYGNSGNEGFGIKIIGDSDALIDHCFIHDNFFTSGAGYGAGIYVSDAHPMIRNCTFYHDSTTTEGGAIYLNSQYAGTVIRNCIFNRNFPDAIHYNTSDNVTTDYNDFFENNNNNFTGNPDPALGTITGVNVNLDPCDNYFNILEGPQFVAVFGDSAFFLQAASPCIDAGDPASPYDPDGTVSDQGAKFFGTPEFNPNLVISIVDDDIHLDWDDAGAQQYYIYRSDTPYYDITQMVAYSAVTTNHFEDSGAMNSGPYFYIISAEY